MVSAVLFTKDLRKVATFYTRVCSAELKNEDAHHAIGVHFRNGCC
jgi:catechol-2,3-dioxygenase